MTRPPSSPYICVRCNYSTPKKSNMENHLYKKKNLCDNISNIELTDDIKKSILKKIPLNNHNITDNTQQNNTEQNNIEQMQNSNIQKENLSFFMNHVKIQSFMFFIIQQNFIKFNLLLHIWQNKNIIKKIDNAFGYIYLIKTKECIVTNRNIYKFGSTKNIDTRFYTYPKHSHLIFSISIYNYKMHEKQIRILLSQKFYRRKQEFGNEFFQGNCNHIIQTIYHYIFQHNIIVH